MTVPVQDHWAPLNHKALMNDEFIGSVPLPPTWVPRHELRRLNAYSILGAYLSNNASVYVQASQEAKDARREYGDPDLLVSQVASAIIGRGARLSVAGADKPPEEPPEGADPQLVTEYQRVKAEFSNLVQRQTEMDEWADTEEWGLRIAEEENNCVGLGDGVYWLTWSAERKRAILRSLDPGLYFPVYGPRDDAKNFPRKVHIAFEYEDEPEPGKVKRYLRRITYELVDLEAPRSVAYQKEPVTRTCLLSDLTWDMNEIRNGLLDLSVANSFVEMGDDGEPLFERDLLIDFIPIVHVPNMGSQPWGTSILSRIAHILDDLQMADTNASDAAEVAGGPPIVVSGATTSETYSSYGPKTVWEVAAGGSAAVLDTSEGLASLHEHTDRLFKRLSTNAQVPEEVLGKVGANEVPSGLTLSLSFGPFEVMIERARLVRSFKYRLLLKMVQRLHVQGGAWQGDVYPAEVTFGSALPSDINGLTEILTKLTGNKAIMSRVSAVRMLADAGLAIPDIATETDRVIAEDFEGGNLVYRATRSPALAAEYLRLELPEDVLMEQLGKLLGREIKLDEVRALFDAQIASERMAATQAAHMGATVDGNRPPKEGGTGPAPSKPDAKQQGNVNARGAGRNRK